MRKAKAIKIKDLIIGGGHPVRVQSMTKTDTTDVDGTVAQIDAMMRAGCEIVRIAVPDKDAALALKEIRRRVPDVPLVADIHFHYKLALLALEAGIDKLRLNPGNIGSLERVREVVKATKERGIPIRIGVNGGSLEKDLLKQYGTATPPGGRVGLLSTVYRLSAMANPRCCISICCSIHIQLLLTYRLPTLFTMLIM